MTGLLEQRIAVVTGGGQGLGRAISTRLALEGAHVVVADLNEETAKTTAAAIMAKTDRQAISCMVDVTDETQVKAMVDRTVQEFGRVDVVVSNAGILIAEEVTEFPAEKWRAVINVNLFGYFLIAKHAAPVMKAQRRGSFFKSTASRARREVTRIRRMPRANLAGSDSPSIALELAEYGVRVNSICPGNLLDSPLWNEGPNSLYKQYAKKWGITEEEVRQRYIDQVPMKRGCTYEDVCNVVAFLASD